MQPRCGASTKMTVEQAETMEEIRKKYNLKRRTAKAIADRFLAADEDGSETLDYVEFLKLLELEDTRLSKNVFNTMDKKENLDKNDKPGAAEGMDGVVDFKEFAEEMARIDTMSPEERMKWTFSVYDKNKNGFLDLNEIHGAMNDPNVGIKFSSERLQSIFHSRACRNVNKITSTEFVIQCKKHEILEMPVKLIYAKVKSYVFDFDENDDEFEEKASRKFDVDYSRKRDETFVKDDQLQEKLAKSGRGAEKHKAQKNTKTKKAADGTVWEDSD